MDKYEEAIAFLKKVEPGSYFDECASLMEELLAAQAPAAEPLRKAKRKYSSIEEAAARQQPFGADVQWRRRMAQRGASSAMLKDE
jgi:hypothetical protein